MDDVWFVSQKAVDGDLALGKTDRPYLVVTDGDYSSPRKIYVVTLRAW